MSHTSQAYQTHDSRNRSNVKDLCTRMWDVTALRYTCVMLDIGLLRIWAFYMALYLEFKIMTKISNLKIYSPWLVSVVYFAYFVAFGGFSGLCRCFLEMKSRLDTAAPKDLEHDAVFSAKFESTAWYCPPTQRRIVHCSPFLVGLEKFLNFPL